MCSSDLTPRHQAIAIIDSDVRSLELRLWGLRPSRVRRIGLEGTTGHLGITVGANESGPGCRVLDLNPDDAAYVSGVRVGDVILAICGTPVANHGHTISLFEAHAQSLAVLLVPAADDDVKVRHGASRWVRVRHGAQRTQRT